MWASIGSTWGLVIFQHFLFSTLPSVHGTPKVGCFFKTFKIRHLCCFITWLVKKLQQWSLYEVIEDILPFVLNTKRPLSDIWLLSYKQNSFGCFLTKVRISILSKNTQNCFAYISATKFYLKSKVRKNVTAWHFRKIWYFLPSLSGSSHFTLFGLHYHAPKGKQKHLFIETSGGKNQLFHVTPSCNVQMSGDCPWEGGS